MIAKVIGCDIEGLKTIKTYKGTMAALGKEIRREIPGYHAKIKKLEHDVTKYGTIILGMPVWLNDIPSPMKTFIESVDWRGLTVHPFFSTGGIYSGVYGEVVRRCGGASVKDPLYIIYGKGGRFLRIDEPLRPGDIINLTDNSDGVII